jgi:hypothetical protein
LPSPDIEIGLRHPVNLTMPRSFPDRCDLVHSRHKKVAGNPSMRRKRSFGGIQLSRFA